MSKMLPIFDGRIFFNWGLVQPPTEKIFPPAFLDKRSEVRSKTEASSGMSFFCNKKTFRSVGVFFEKSNPDLK